MNAKAKKLREALEALEDENDGWLEVHGSWDISAVALNKHAYVAADAARTIALPILERDEGLVDSRDVVDPYVAEMLYDEHIAHNIEARGGIAVESDWSSWEELPAAGRDYWMSLAVTARLARLAALITTDGE